MGEAIMLKISHLQLYFKNMWRRRYWILVLHNLYVLDCIVVSSLKEAQIIAYLFCFFFLAYNLGQKCAIPKIYCHSCCILGCFILSRDLLTA